MTLPKRIIPPLFVVLWATGFIGARYAMPWSEPFTFLAIRFAIAGAILGALVVFSAHRLRRRQAAHAVIAGALLHGVYLGGAFWAIHHGLPAGLAALIAGLQPLVTAAVAGSVLGERTTPKLWLGLAVGFLGVVIVLLPKLDTAGGVTWQTLAAAFVALAGITSGTIWQKRFAGGGDLVAVTACQYLGATILMGVASLAFEHQQMTVNGELVFAMVWLIFVLSIGAIFLLMMMIREGEMSKVASLFYLVPAVTAVMAYLLFGETLSPVQIAGMALTMVGVALAVQPGPGTRARASR